MFAIADFGESYFSSFYQVLKRFCSIIPGFSDIVF